MSIPVIPELSKNQQLWVGMVHSCACPWAAVRGRQAVVAPQSCQHHRRPATSIDQVSRDTKVPPPPLLLHMGLSERGDTVFPHFWVFFSWKHRFCASNAVENVVCGGRKGPYVCQGVGVAVIPCALVLRGGCCFVVSCSEGGGLAYVCNACSVARAARYHGPVPTRQPPASAPLPLEPQPMARVGAGGDVVAGSYRAGRGFRLSSSQGRGLLQAPPECARHCAELS